MLEFDAFTAENIQGAPDGQVYLSSAQRFDLVEVLDSFAASSIGDWY